MARRLAVTVLFIGLSTAGAVSRAQTPPGSTPNTKVTSTPTSLTPSNESPGNSQSPGDAKPQSGKPTGEGKPGDGRPGDGRPGDGKPGDGKPGEGRPRPFDRREGERHDGDKRDGDKHDGDKRDGDFRMGDRRFGIRSLMEAIRRDGGPLELAPILLSKNALRELDIKDTVKTDVESFFQGLQKKWEEDRKTVEANPNAPQPTMHERVAEVSKNFNELFQKLSPQEQERVLGAFIQWRKYRSLSNRMIAVDKLGMTNEQAAELRQTIDSIRDEVLNESRDKFRQLWESGRDRSEADQLMHKNREKMDERIKAKLSSEQIEKLEQLRGKPLSEETLKGLDIPPPPPRR